MQASAKGLEHLDDESADGAGRPLTHPESVADYVADMAGQLSRMARRAELDLLAYLLDVARLEAETACDDVQAWEAEL